MISLARRYRSRWFSWGGFSISILVALAVLGIYLKLFLAVVLAAGLVGRKRASKGADLRLTLEIGFEEAAFGIKKKLSLTEWMYVPHVGWGHGART